MSFFSRFLFFVGFLFTVHIIPGVLSQNSLFASKPDAFSTLSFSININLIDNTVEIDVNGPNDRWFAVGFGSQRMANTYTIIMSDNTTIEEFKLGDHNMGNRLNEPMVNVLYDIINVSNNQRSVKLKRNRIGLTSDYYTFPNEINKEINVIYAIGTDDIFDSQTYMAEYKGNIIKFIDPSINNDGNNNEVVRDCNSFNQTLIGGQFINIGNDINIAFNIYCKLKIIELILNYNNYKNNWFGIVFNDQMINSNALIFTTGKSTEVPRSLNLYSYYLSAKELSGINYQSLNNWNKISQTINNNKVSLIYEQILNNTKFNINTTEIIIRYAIGSNLNLEKHIINSDTFIINLLTGKVDIKKDDNTLKIIHGIFMFIAWGIGCSFAIISSKFRWIFVKFGYAEYYWFLYHRWTQCCVLILTWIGFIVAIIFTENNNNKHFSNDHMIIGLIIIIFATLQPINAFFRPHPPNKEKNELKSLKRLIWEIIHKFIGYSIWIIAQINIYLGIKILNNSTVPALQIVWICILILIFIGLYAYYYYSEHKNKNNKQQIHDDNNKDTNNVKNEGTNNNQNSIQFAETATTTTNQ